MRSIEVCLSYDGHIWGYSVMIPCFRFWNRNIGGVHDFTQPRADFRAWSFGLSTQRLHQVWDQVVRSSFERRMSCVQCHLTAVNR